MAKWQTRKIQNLLNNIREGSNPSTPTIAIFGENQMGYREDLICQNTKRISQLGPVVSELMYKIDLGNSKVYNRKETLQYVTMLRDVLAQIDADLSALDTLLDD